VGTLKDAAKHTMTNATTIRRAILRAMLVVGCGLPNPLELWSRLRRQAAARKHYEFECLASLNA
jgi:hypothetical protein